MGVYQKKLNDGTKAWYYDFMHNKVRYRAVGGTTKTQALRVLDKKRGEVFSGNFEIDTRVTLLLINAHEYTSLLLKNQVQNLGTFGHPLSFILL